MGDFTADWHPPRLGLVTCETDGSQGLYPKGHHLRWFVPSKLGFPAGGFEIRRLAETTWKNVNNRISEKADLTGKTRWHSSPNWSHRDLHHSVHPLAVIISRDDAVLNPTRNGLQVAQAGKGDYLLLHFRIPVIRVRLKLEAESRRTPGRRSGSRSRPGRRRKEMPSIILRHHAVLIDEVPLTPEIDIERPGMTDVLIPNRVKLIQSLTFVTEAAAAETAHRNGRLLTELKLPTGAAAAYKLTRVAKGIRNRFFEGDDPASLQKRYPIQSVKQLVIHLQSTINNPRQAVMAPAAPGRPPAPVRPFDFIQLAALDPNLARMLALYWVDLSPEPGLYVVRADYADPQKTLAHGLAFSRHAAAIPAFNPGPKARRLEGIDYVDRKPTGRVGLTWPLRPHRLSEPNRPVMIDVDRISGDKAETITGDQPRVVSATDGIRFTDRRIPVPAKVHYAVTPIDIFGRSGKPAETGPVEVVDLEVPVPPKHVRAALMQHGAPWLVPQDRNADRDLTGTVDATAEFGEAQHLVAPDARRLRWCWRSGPAQDRNPGAWATLDFTNITPPKQLALEWPAGSRLSRAPVQVAEARMIDDEALTAKLDRLDPLTRSAAESVDPGPPMRELLLACALLEPDLFTGWQIAIDAASVPVFGSTAGIAAKDDGTVDLRLTARLFVPDNENSRKIEDGQVLHLDHPEGANWRPDNNASPPPVLAIPLPAENVSKDRAHGGELAIDLHHILVPAADGSLRFKPVDHNADHPDRRIATVVGRIVADHDPDGVRSVLIRIRPNDADRLLEIERDEMPLRTVARHHRPYVMPQAKLGLESRPGDIQLDFAPEQRFETLWISATAIDGGNKESIRVATPFELRVMRPPPDTRPARPFPEREGNGAAHGELSPPDVNGEATVAVAWAAVAGGSGADCIRYELARALDTSIVATDRKRWLHGAATDEAQALGVVPGPSVDLSLHAGYEIMGSNGTVKVTADKPSEAGMAILSGIRRGRIRIVHRVDQTPGSNQKEDRMLHHRLLRASENAAGDIELVFQPFVEPHARGLGEIKAGRCRIDGLPNYAQVLTDDDRLRQLADIQGSSAADGNEQAFGLVTGAPVRGLRFADRLPGRGRSRFFYKVRAVFPGNTRSAWSPSSVAFHQLNATPAEPPLDLHVRRLAASTLVTFRLPEDPHVVGVRLSATTAAGRIIDQQDLLLDSDGSPLVPARITADRGLVDLRVFEAPATVAHGGPTILTGVFPAEVDQDHPQETENLLDPDQLARGIAVLSSRDHDGLRLAVRVGSGGEAGWFDHLPGRYEVQIADAGDADPPHSRRLSVLKYVSVKGTALALHSEATVVVKGGEHVESD